MLSVLFSIKPEYVDQIFSGKKHFEFRTVVCKKPIDKIIIYETSPISKIVGEVSVSKIIKNTPEKLWQATKAYAGIDLKSYSKYFLNREYAYAYVLENPIKYETPKSLNEYNILMPPQNFVYLKISKSN